MLIASGISTGKARIVASARDQRLERAVDKCAQWVHSTKARELVNNAACSLILLESMGEPADPEAAFLEAIQTRLDQGRVTCSNPELAAREIARSWKGTNR